MAKKEDKTAKTYKNLAQIKKDIFDKTLYIYGKDVYIGQCIVKNIAQKYLNADVIKLNIKTFDGKKTKAEDIINEINTLPVFDNYKLIVINNFSFEKKSEVKKTKTKPKSGSDKVTNLSDFLFDKPQYALIVLFSQDMPYISNSIVRQFKERGAAYELNGCDINDDFLKKWLLKKAKDLNFALDDKKAEFFLSYIGYYEESAIVNAQMLYNELCKLSFYCADKKTVEIEYIKKICTPYLPESIDSFINALNRKDIKKASLLLSELIKNNVYPAIALNSIVYNFDIMLLYKNYSAKSNASPWDIYNKIKSLNGIKYVSYGKVNNIKKYSMNFTDKKIKSIIYSCAKYDNGVKSGFIDAKIGLERIVYFICT